MEHICQMWIINAKCVIQLVKLVFNNPHFVRVVQQIKIEYWIIQIILVFVILDFMKILLKILVFNVIKHV